MSLYDILLFIHLLAMTIWVGGMALMHFVVRPVAADLLEPPQRLPFMTLCLGRFFTWVTSAIVLLLGSGIGMMIIMKKAGSVPLSVHIMSGTGLLMMAIFGHIRLAAYPRLRRSVAEKDWSGAAQALAPIRRLVGVNLVLGVLTIAVASLGRMLG